MIPLLTLLFLILVYLSKKLLTKSISYLVHLLGGTQHGTIILWSLIFLPGTILHEISHFFFAIFTGAKSGKVEILPEYLDEEFSDEGKRGVALGYVQTSRLNPLQGFLVGLAPFIVGSIFLIWFSFLLEQFLHQKNYSLLLLFLYLFFTIANSFFPSWADIKQTLPFIVILLIILFAAIIYRYPFNSWNNFPFVDQVTILNQALLFATSLNLFLVFLIRGIIYLWPKPKKSHYQNR